MKPWGSTLSMSGNAVWSTTEEEQSEAEPWPCSSHTSHTTIPPSLQGLTMPVSDVKMTISYKGASCWNKVSMPGRFLNLQPVASWGDNEKSKALRLRGPQKNKDPA